MSIWLLDFLAHWTAQHLLLLPVSRGLARTLSPSLWNPITDGWEHKATCGSTHSSSGCLRLKDFSCTVCSQQKPSRAKHVGKMFNYSTSGLNSSASALTVTRTNCCRVDKLTCHFENTPVFHLHGALFGMCLTFSYVILALMDLWIWLGYYALGKDI